MKKKAISPVHPGELLQTEFLDPMGISAYKLAQAAGITQTHLGQILRGQRSITPIVGIRLSRALGLTDHFWINAQSHYDYESALDESAEQLEQIRPLVAV